MHPSRLGISLVPIGIALCTQLFAIQVHGAEPELTPITRPLKPKSTAIPRLAMEQPAPALPPKEIVPVPRDAEPGTDSCCGSDANCQPYYRNRPKGCHPNQIKFANRIGEPDWYRYYRCVHFGYHPTQWHAWPDGWLTCRHPQPGKHPYDIERPRPDRKILDRERRLQGERPEPDLLDDPLPRGPEELPRDLPPPQSTIPPPLTPGQDGPSSVPDVPNPIIR